MPERVLLWGGSSKDDPKAFPSDVQDVMGFALWVAQTGGKHPDAKPLPGFGGAGVLEVVDAHDGDAYRVVSTLTLPEAVSVRHAFQKKSKRGVATPKLELELIRQRLRWAEELHAQGAFKRCRGRS